MARPRRDAGILRAIAIFKLAKATILAITAVGLLNLLDPGKALSVRLWLTRISGTLNLRALEWILFRFDTLNSRRLAVMTFAAGAYAGLFAVEGIGLWMRKRWAEYLTIIATGSLIPFEVWEVTRRLSALRVTMLVLNVLVVVYLIYQVREDRHQGSFAPSFAPGS